MPSLRMKIGGQYVHVAGIQGPPGEGFNDSAHDLGNVGTTLAVNLANGHTKYGTLTENVTIELPAVPAGKATHVTLLLNNGASGRSVSVTGVGGFVWVGDSAPSLNTAASQDNLFIFKGIPGKGWVGDGVKC